MEDKGISVVLCFGTKWGGLYVRASKTSFRICLGYVAMTVWFIDIERGWRTLYDLTKRKYDSKRLQADSVSVEARKTERA